MHDDSIVLYGPRIDNVYAINMNNISSNELSWFKASLDDIWLWPHRLGHATTHTIEKLSQLDLARGLPLYKFEKDRICNAGIKEKQ